MKLFKTRTASLPASTAPGDGAASTAPSLEEQLKEMSFLEHLEELRWTILKALGGVLVTTIVCSFFADWIIDVLLLGPTYRTFFMYDLFGIEAVDLHLQNRTITGQFFAYWGTVLVVGLIAGSPVVVYYLWKFIEPGLYRNERKGLRFASMFATFFFMLGIAFGYLVITPLALQFFAAFSISDQIVNEFDITRYFSMVTFWAFGVGMLFQMPVVVFFFAKLGLLTPARMRAYRKYALIVILILGALLTPPDPISQVLVALPLLLLYEVSIYVAAWVERRRGTMRAEPPLGMEPPAA